MKNHRKDTKTSAITHSDTSEMLNRARSTMDRAVQTLDRCVERVTEILEADEYNNKLASHLAWLAKQLAGITGELRKLEAHEEKISKNMSPEKRHAVVMAYLRSLPHHRQREVAEEIKRMIATVSTTGGMLAQ